MLAKSWDLVKTNRAKELRNKNPEMVENRIKVM